MKALDLIVARAKLPISVKCDLSRLTCAEWIVTSPAGTSVAFDPAHANQFYFSHVKELMKK